MKTPKRHHELTTMEHISTERVWDHSQEQVNSQRWKRKNRIKQLKRTIQKYKDGTMLPELSHLRIAYRWLQKLKEPKSGSPISAWQSYLNGIRGVRNMLNIACEDAAVCFGIALEMEERKEQK